MRSAKRNTGYGLIFAYIDSIQVSHIYASTAAVSLIALAELCITIFTPTFDAGIVKQGTRIAQVTPR
jgi:hypothetical protein